MLYTSLFLDIDNTILDFYKAEAEAVRKVMIKHGIPHSDKDVKIYSNINQTYWERFEKGEIPKSDIFEGRFKTLLEYYGIDGDSAAISEDYKNNLSEGYFKMEGAIEILEYLRSKGYKLYATTNGLSSTQFKRIKNSGVEPYFDKIFVSEEAGHQKPEKEYFDYVIANIPEKDKSKMLVVGDSPSSDILGAINSGLDACWFNPEHKAPKYETKYEVHTLYELKNIL